MSKIVDELEDIIKLIHINCGYNRPCSVESQGKRAILNWHNSQLQAFIDDLEEALPEAWRGTIYGSTFEKGREEAIYETNQAIKSIKKKWGLE